ncbi:MTH938/NDUFAF3 family protein [Sphingobium subterraneum]|uniref:Uncharacterized protein n=1 Tax=Sphingobium subterraneum TaxID=627688 RepID=A0A841IX52_9SPHN|nr:MTH938/NDUFAF3 family protein [Sphingobium subterraneum]MBB6122722.1 uncharacterized protein [Sphingobium subterraneum]
MEFRRKDAVSGPVVAGFSSGGGFRLRDEAGMAEERLCGGGVLLTPVSALDWSFAGAIDALDEADFRPLFDLEPAPEFLLLGTGTVVCPPPPRLARALDRRGIGIEAMDSRAAARAWGVLRAEERWIVAALLPLAG